VSCHLLEFDERYSARGDFSLYDYNAPTAVPAALHGAFDVVVADPPYLARECFLKTAETVRLLRRSAATPVLFLTGAVMRPVALAALGARPCVFRPQHSSKLGNEFLCYSTYEPAAGSGLGGWDATLRDAEGESDASAAAAQRA
jgi:hypothetical protein